VTLQDLLATLLVRPALTLRAEVIRIDVTIPELPAALDGFRIAHISDLHVGHGKWVPLRALEMAALVHAERPNLVVNTGDYLQDEPPIEKVRELVRPLVLDSDGGSAGPVNLAVLGNHDHYAGDAIVCELKTMLHGEGVRVLVNEVATVCKRGARLSIAGLDSYEPGFDRAVAALTEAPHPRLLLVHEADLVERLPEGAADLVLSGHSHGGQISLPGLTGWIVRRFNGSKYVHGHYRINGNPVYINRGVGYTGIPLRFRARPELTIIRLRR
jgi:predicted MPP superfamily phosphohydrolase